MQDLKKETARVYKYDEWLPWEQNASPMLLVHTLNAGMRNLRDYFGTPLWTSVIIFENNQGKWLFRPKELKLLGQKMIDFLMCPPYRVAFMTGYEEAEKKLLKYAQEIQFTVDLAGINDVDLIRQFEDYSHVYYDWYKYGWFCEPIQFQSQDVLISFLEKELKKKSPEIDVNTIKQALFAIEEETFAVGILKHTLECVKALDKVLKNKQISNKIQAISEESNFPQEAAKIMISIINKGKAHEDFKILFQKLIEHSNMFYWKRNNYFSTQFLTENDILVELFASDKFDISGPVSPIEKELQNIAQNKEKLLKEKRGLLEKLPRYERNLAILASSIGGLIDRRKKSIMIANSAFDCIVEEVANRTKTDINSCRFLIPQELKYFLDSPEEYRERFEERRKLFIVCQGDFPLLDELFPDLSSKDKVTNLSFGDIAMDDPFMAEGKYAESVLNQLNSRLNFMVSTDTAVFGNIQGVTIYYDPNQPTLTGRTRVIRDPKSEYLESGEILIAPSTTPDYIDAIKRCSAIVTDWGGQTSHAAITSLELRKPCMIGTNYASQVLKTGDEISIDFKRSIIEIVNQK